MSALAKTYRLAVSSPHIPVSHPGTLVEILPNEQMSGVSMERDSEVNAGHGGAGTNPNRGVKTER